MLMVWNIETEINPFENKACNSYYKYVLFLRRMYEKIYFTCWKENEYHSSYMYTSIFIYV